MIDIPIVLDTDIRIKEKCYLVNFLEQYIGHSFRLLVYQKKRPTMPDILVYGETLVYVEIVAMHFLKFNQRHTYCLDINEISNIYIGPNVIEIYLKEKL